MMNSKKFLVSMRLFDANQHEDRLGRVTKLTAKGTQSADPWSSRCYIITSWPPSSDTDMPRMVTLTVIICRSTPTVQTNYVRREYEMYS